MKFNTTYNKILTDENLMETIQHGSKNYPFHFYHDNLALFDFHCVEWHWHAEFEFVLVQTGVVTFSIADTQFLLPAGSGLFINSKVLHRFYSPDEAIIPNFVCMPTFLASDNSLIYEKYVAPIVNASLPCQIFTPDVPWQSEILVLMRNIIAAHDTEQINQLLISSLMQQLWNILYQHTDIDHAKQAPSSAGTLARLQLMMQYIHSNYASPVSLDDIAHSVNISKSSALALFHRYLHTTPVTYLIHYRLKEAARLLCCTESNVCTIAQTVGFDNTAYFCRKFKEYFQITPSRYRALKTQTAPSISCN